MNKNLQQGDQEDGQQDQDYYDKDNEEYEENYNQEYEERLEEDVLEEGSAENEKDKYKENGAVSVSL